MGIKKQYSKKRRVLNFIGMMLMVAVIAATIPLNVPKWCGLQIFEVLTGSMEPVYPVGSVVYVKEAKADEIKEEDAITYTLGTNSEYVMTHRVTQIFKDEQAFMTKGDANETEDMEKVPFTRLIGRPVFCIPYLGFVSDYFHTAMGKAACACIFIAALLMWLFAEFQSRRVLRWIGLGMIVFSAAGITLAVVEYQRGEKEYKRLQEFVMTGNMETDVAERVEEGVEERVEEGVEEGVYVPQLQIAQQLSELKQQNQNVIGWIAFDEEKISYPIMQTQDNQHYLTHTFSEKKNRAGSIFMDAGNTEDFTDHHSIIYGHNMKNGSMFGRLKQYYDEEFYKGNEFFTIYTENQAYRYEIFSAHIIPETDEIYTIWYAPEERAAEYKKFIERMKKNSWYDTGVETTGKDKVVTLSTCTASDEKRFVVHGKLAAVYLLEY